MALVDRSTMQHKRHKPGVTLIEILVAVAVIVIMAGVLWKMGAGLERIIKPAFDDRRVYEYVKSIIENSASNQKGNH